MIRLKSITIENFGPYYKTQSLDFPDGDGVVFVWAGNGHGKTSFLNAIQFALWGTVRDEEDDVMAISSFVNLYAVDDKEGMSVQLDCDVDDVPCTIKRRLIRRENTAGTKDEDYEISLTVKRNFVSLSPQEAKSFLAHTLPEKISQFYMFDAELLARYKRLIQYTKDNRELKASIENILGMPILENSHVSLVEITKGAFQDYKNALKEDKSNKKNQTTLDLNVQRLEELKLQLADLHKELSETASDIESLEIVLSENKEYKKLLDEENKIVTVLKARQLVLDDCSMQLTSSLDNLWRVFLNLSLEPIISKKKDEMKGVQDEIAKHKDNDALKHIWDSIVNLNLDTCPTCSHHLGDTELHKIKEQLQNLKVSPVTALNSNLTHLSIEVADLSKYLVNTDINSIISIIEKFLLARDEVTGVQFQLNQLRAKKKTFSTTISDEELQQKHKDLYDKKGLLEEIKGHIQEFEDKIKEQEEHITGLKKLISKSASKAVIAAGKRHDFVESLEKILSLAISKFRDNLKIDVQTSATQLFKSICHYDRYDRLEINDNYGLQIVAVSERIVPNRSSGYEQVVALSLLGALHKNAPIAGPIVMDSTFQKIDPEHRHNTLMTLPQFGKQIIVLAIPNFEVIRQEAIDVLGNKYLADFHIERLDEFHSIIEPGCPT